MLLTRSQVYHLTCDKRECIELLKRLGYKHSKSPACFGEQQINVSFAEDGEPDFDWHFWSYRLPTSYKTKKIVETRQNYADLFFQI